MTRIHSNYVNIENAQNTYKTESSKQTEGFSGILSSLGSFLSSTFSSLTGRVQSSTETSAFGKKWRTNGGIQTHISIGGSPAFIQSKEQSWNLYQTLFSNRGGLRLGKVLETKDAKQLLEEAAQIIKELNPNFEHADVEINLKYAKQLFSEIKTMIHEKVQAGKKLVILNGVFDKKIDRAQQLVCQAFLCMYSTFLDQEDLESAKEVALDMRMSDRGEQRLFDLVAIYLSKKDLVNARVVLNAIPGPRSGSGGEEGEWFMFGQTIKKFMSKLADPSVVVSLLDKEAEYALKRGISDYYLETHNIECFKKITSLMDHPRSKDGQCKQLSRYYLKDGIIEEAKKTISQIRNSYTRDEEYVKLIRYMEKGSDGEVKEVISQIHNSYARDEEYVKLIRYYMHNGNHGEAKEVISQIHNSYTRDEEYIELIRGYLKDEMIEEAKKAISQIHNSYTRDEEYVKLIRCYMRKGKREEAKEAILHIRNSYTRDQAFQDLGRGLLNIN